METISVKECLRFGWKTFRSRTWFYVGAAAILFAVEVVYLSLDSFSKSEESLGAFIVMLAAVALSFLLGMSQVAFSLRAHDAPSSVTLKDLWAPNPFWKFVGTSIIMCILILIGLVLLIVPGIILSVALM